MDTAFYRIPFIYQTAAVRKGGRKIEPLRFGAWADVRIPHVASDDAPASMLWLEIYPGREAHQRETRWFEDDNWEPAVPGSAIHKAVPIHPGDFDRLREIENEQVRTNSPSSTLQSLARAIGQDYYELRSFVCNKQSQNRIVEHDPHEIRETLWSGRAEAEAAVTARARNLLFIDGVLWVRGGEPHYQILTGENSRTPEGTAVISPATEVYPNHSAYHNSFFRADRLDDAIDFARREHGARDVRIESRIEVTITEAVRFDDEGELLCRTALQAIDEGMKSLRTCSTEQAMAWLSLRDCLAREGRTNEDMADCLREYAEAAGTNPAIALPIGRTLRRWGLRPMDMEAFAP